MGDPATSTAPEAPTAEPAPPQAPAVPAAPMGEGAERVAALWDQAIELIRRKRPSTATLLSNAKVGALRGATLFLVAATPTFAQLLRRKDDKMILEKALEHLGLGGLEVQILGPDEAAAKLSSAASAVGEEPKQAGAEPSLLQRVQSLFPKEIVHEVKEEGSR